MRLYFLLPGTLAIALTTIGIAPTYAVPLLLTQETSAAEKSSATQFVGNYYGEINFGRYEQAWRMLAPSLQNNSQRHPQGYNSYLNWWRKVELVTGEATSQQQSGNRAVVIAEIKYQMRSGREVPSRVRVDLLWDSEIGNWLIVNTQKLRSER